MPWRYRGRCHSDIVTISECPLGTRQAVILKLSLRDDNRCLVNLNDIVLFRKTDTFSIAKMFYKAQFISF